MHMMPYQSLPLIAVLYGIGQFTSCRYVARDLQIKCCTVHEFHTCQTVAITTGHWKKPQVMPRGKMMVLVHELLAHNTDRPAYHCDPDCHFKGGISQHNRFCERKAVSLPARADGETLGPTGSDFFRDINLLQLACLLPMGGTTSWFSHERNDAHACAHFTPRRKSWLHRSNRSWGLRRPGCILSCQQLIVVHISCCTCRTP